MSKEFFTAMLDQSVPPLYGIVAGIGLTVYWLIKSNRDSNRHYELQHKSLDAIKETLTKYGENMSLIQQDNQHMKGQIADNKDTLSKDITATETRLTENINETKERVNRMETMALKIGRANER